MANTFEEQARERFGKSTAFLGKARTLLQDDLVARTVLADAVSAIKNMLQGYLLVRISRMQPGLERQDWQEVAASNRMPELIRTCIDAGLTIGDLSREIRRLNDERNIRTHDDPASRVQIEQARQALALARTVAERVNAAIKTSPVGVPSPLTTPAQRSAASSAGHAPASRPVAAASVTPPPSVASPVPPVPPVTSAPAPATPPGVATTTATTTPPPDIADEVDDDEQSTRDDTALIDISGARRGRASGERSGSRLGRLARVGTLAAALLVGVGVGFGGAAAISAHGAPAWLGFANTWLSAGHQRTTQAALTTSPASTPSVSIVPASQTVGTMTVSSTTCASHLLKFTLSNTGTSPLPWAVVSGDSTAQSVGFGFSPTDTPRAAAVGTMPGSSYIDIYVSGLSGSTYSRIEAFGPGGTAQIIANACG